MDNETASPLQPEPVANRTTFGKEEVIGFYKNSLPKILKTVFVNPVDGVYGIFSDKSEQAFFSAAIIMATTAVLYILLPYFMMGDYKEALGGFGAAFKFGIITVILLMLISLAAFGVKSINGKPNFKNELLTGALCGIPLMTLLVFVFIIKLFSSDISPNSLTDVRGLQSTGILAALIVLYSFLMLINILQQSLRASGTNNTLSWYISPAGIIVSFYLASKIGAAFF